MARRHTLAEQDDLSGGSAPCPWLPPLANLNSVQGCRQPAPGRESSFRQMTAPPTGSDDSGFDACHGSDLLSGDVVHVHERVLFGGTLRSSEQTGSKRIVEHQRGEEKTQ
jgi:hypothetical protein